MVTDDELQDRFDRADSVLTLNHGSIEDVKRRAARRTQRTRAVSVAAAVALLSFTGAAIRVFSNDTELVQTLDGDTAQTTLDSSRVDDVDDVDGNDGDNPSLEVEGTDDGIEPSVGDDVGETNATDDSDDAADPERAQASLVSEVDFTYLGAFTVPASEVAGSTFAYGGEAVAFNPWGDPGSSDPFNGSLFLSGHPRENAGVAEITIPAPQPPSQPGGGSSDPLPVAEFVQPFADVTGSRADKAMVVDGDDGATVEWRHGGLHVVDGPGGRRLHWSVWRYYNVTDAFVPGHGHSSLDLSDPDPQGPWFLGDFDNRATAGYMFDVPPSFANDHLNGNRFVAGFKAGPTTEGRSWGPPFFAFTPPRSADPGERVEATVLGFHESAERAVIGFGEADTAGGAEWITTAGGAVAVITVGHRGLGTVRDGLPGDQDCGINTDTHAGPYEPLVLFYDPEDLARVAAGALEPWQLEPYARWNPAEYLIPTCDWLLSAVAFDPASKRVYIVQPMADASQNPFAPTPVIHVFQI